MSDKEAQNPEVEMLFSLARQRYGDRLNADELEEVRKGVEGMAEIAESLRAVKLENGDEPFSLFRPYREDV